MDAEAKSISHSHTFENDTRDRAMLDAMLSRLCQKAAKRLREAGLDARTVTVTIRYAGFETVTRAKTLPEPAHLDQVFLEIVRQLFDRHWDRKRAVRLVGVELGDLSHGERSSICSKPRGAKSSTSWRGPRTSCASASASAKCNSAARSAAATSARFVSDPARDADPSPAAWTQYSASAGLLRFEKMAHLVALGFEVRARGL